MTMRDRRRERVRYELESAIERLTTGPRSHASMHGASASCATVVRVVVRDMTHSEAAEAAQKALQQARKLEAQALAEPLESSARARMLERARIAYSVASELQKFS